MMRAVTAAAALFLAPSVALASDWEELAKEGYAVFEETKIEGEFNGCEYGKRYELDNGLVFVCREYNYSYDYYPDVYILKNVRSGALKVVVEDEEFDGDLYSSR